MGNAKDSLTDRPPSRAASRQQVLNQVRQAVWQMRSSEDLRQVVLAVRAGLEALAIPFEICEVNHLDLNADPPRVRTHSLESTTDWQTVGKQGGLALLLRIWQTGQPAYRPDLETEDLNEERDLIKSLWDHPVRAVLDVPFSHGTLALNSRQSHAFSADHIEAVSEIAGVLSEGWARLADLEALERRALEAEALAQAIAAVASEVDLNQVLQTVVEQAQKMVGAERTTLFLYDEAEAVLIPRAQVGHEWEVYQQVRLQPGESESGQVLVSGQPRIYDHRLRSGADTMRLETWSLLVASTQSVGSAGAVVPLKLAGRVVGTLSVSTGQRPCTPRHLLLLEQLASPAVLAIERAQHLRAMEQEMAARQRTEAELRVSEAGLRQAQHVARLGSWAWHIQENRLEWSDEMYRVFGIDKETFSGVLSDVIAQAIHPDDRAAVEAANRLVAEEGKSSPMEYRVVWSDQTVHTVWAEAGELVLDESGNPRILTGIVQDITEQKHAEETLRQSEKALREAQTLGKIGNWGYDLITQEVTWSDQVYELYERDKALGPPTVEEETRYYTPEETRRLHEFARLAAETGSDFEYDFEVTLPNGVLKWFHGTLGIVQK